MLHRFGVAFEYFVVKISRKEKVKLKWLLNQKMATIGLSKIWEYRTNVHLRIEELESRGQQLPVIKKNLFESILNIETSLFY